MTVKRVFMFVLLIVLIVCLSSCSKLGDSADDISINEHEICDFAKICETDYKFGNHSSLWYDKTTGGVYLLIYGTYMSSFTPVFNADGTLKIWDGYKKGGSDVQQEVKVQD